MNQLANKPAGRSGGGRSRALDVDHYVSLRIRQRRIMLGLTQQQMAELIGVTYQQAHKYETGINRISAGRLYQIAQALGVEISYFFEDVDPERRGRTKASELMPQQRMLLELARNFAASAAASTRTPCATSPGCWPTAATPRSSQRLAWACPQRGSFADDAQGLGPQAEIGQLGDREPADRRRVVAGDRLARGRLGGEVHQRIVVADPAVGLPLDQVDRGEESDVLERAGRSPRAPRASPPRATFRPAAGHRPAATIGRREAACRAGSGARARRARPRRRRPRRAGPGTPCSSCPYAISTSTPAASCTIPSKISASVTSPISGIGPSSSRRIAISSTFGPNRPCPRWREAR